MSYSPVINVGLKLLLAALSGVLLALVFETDMDHDWIANLDWLPVSDQEILGNRPIECCSNT